MYIGKVAFEGIGAYCMSKSAIESFTDVLRLEMRKWKVKVCAIEPSGYITGRAKY
jgi:NAD(P)-dependent dehydrogenase (short-subunit alcohol dehydrogenase family)